MGYVARKYPGMSLKLQQADLTNDEAVSTLESGLTLGLHPEMTGGRADWIKIISNVMRACYGTCVIATFYERGMQRVQQACMFLGVRHVVHENPYWRIRPVPTTNDRPPYLRYILVASGDSSRQAGLVPNVTPLVEGQTII